MAEIAVDITGFSLDEARSRTGRGYGHDTDWPKIRIVRGRGLDMATDKSRSRSVRGLDTDMFADRCECGLCANTAKLWSWSGTGCGHGTDMVTVKMRAWTDCGRGCGLDKATDWPRKRARSIYGHDPGLDTDMVTDKIRSRTDRDHGLVAVTVTVWTWTVCGRGNAAVWSRTGHDHGHHAGHWRGYFRPSRDKFADIRTLKTQGVRRPLSNSHKSCEHSRRILRIGRPT